MFPLIVADDVMARLPSERTSKAAELKDIVADGIARVTSMLRSDAAQKRYLSWTADM